MIITLDGPAGSGKSTIARLLAQQLDFEYIDSGALYRTLTLHAIRNFGGAEGNEPKVAQYFEQNPGAIEVRFEAHHQLVQLSGEDITQAIRDPDLTRQIRYIAGHGPCRDLVNAYMRELSHRYSVVVDGRDIGTVVFPESKNKFYLDASPQIRAKRRALEQNSPVEGPDFEALVAEISDRDQSDMTRELAPLKKAQDAQLIQTDQMSIEEVVDAVKGQLDLG